jgi:15-cis-phytoene synthase
MDRSRAELDACYDRCRRMQRRHDPTYYWATQRLPRVKRPATHALYGYVRAADELVDGPRRAAEPEERRSALNAWEAELAVPRHPVSVALVDAAHCHHLPVEELHAYMAAMRSDCGPVRIATWEELDVYMDGSAGTVGRIMAALLDVPEPHRADFGRLGQAFQLTNFLRDVRKDAQLGRIYIPLGFGAGLEDAGAVRTAVATGVSRARGRFAACDAAIAAAPVSVRRGIRLACSVYGDVLDRIEAVDFDVLGRRTAAPRWRVAVSAVTALRA